jgi:hypothetical protein
LLAIQKHLLGIAPFDYEYQLVAADVNRDGMVSAADILELRKLMLGQIPEFTNNDSWRFFYLNGLSTEDPFDWQEVVTLPQFSGFAESVNFGGIKIGDVMNTQNGIRDMTGSLIIEDIEVQSGDEVHFPVYGPENFISNAMQFELAFRDAEVISITSGAIESTDLYIDSDALRVLWSDPANSTQNEALFYVRLKVHRSGHLHEMIGLSKTKIKAQAITASSRIMSLELEMKEIYRNAPIDLNAFPNPASEKTVLSFDMPEDEQVNIRVTDVSGVVLYEREVNAVQGENQLTLSRVNLSGYRGIVICQLETMSGLGIVKVVF